MAIARELGRRGTRRCRWGRCESGLLIVVHKEQADNVERGTAWEVAHVALFLGSDEAKHIIGQRTVVDGGLIDASPRPLESTSHRRS